ncbi:hypothetical protein ABW20_dc0107272 [Dactylellina cionopaga]|nr:hypothetical protein ABW20_dc0107272 [Dactylellina cionopaga]
MVILVDKVHAPVRDSRNPFKNLIGFLGNDLIAWKRTVLPNENKTTPIVISLTKLPTFTAIFAVPNTLYGLTATLTRTVVSNPSITFTSQPFTLGAFSKPGDNVDPQVASNSAMMTKLSIYALVDDLAPSFMKEGIPLQFLERMIPSTKTITSPLTTRDEWITWIIWRCFTSKSDPYVKVNFPDKWQQAIHYYRYNSFLGSSSNFTIEGGSIFDLDQWLLNCTPPAPGQWYGVNCYDQPALVQTALSLGVPYYYVDSNNK